MMPRTYLASSFTAFLVYIGLIQRIGRLIRSQMLREHLSANLDCQGIRHAGQGFGSRRVRGRGEGEEEGRSLILSWPSRAYSITVTVEGTLHPANFSPDVTSLWSAWTCCWYFVIFVTSSSQHLLFKSPSQSLLLTSSNPISVDK
jgi:hypothetical protein